MPVSPHILYGSQISTSVYLVNAELTICRYPVSDDTLGQFVKDKKISIAYIRSEEWFVSLAYRPKSQTHTLAG